jgi:hypothetical protein
MPVSGTRTNSSPLCGRSSNAAQRGRFECQPGQAHCLEPNICFRLNSAKSVSISQGACWPRSRQWISWPLQNIPPPTPGTGLSSVPWFPPNVVAAPLRRCGPRVGGVFSEAFRGANNAVYGRRTMTPGSTELNSLTLLYFLAATSGPDRRRLDPIACQILQGYFKKVTEFRVGSAFGAGSQIVFHDA